MSVYFELKGQFESFCGSGKQLVVTNDGFIIADDGENVNYLRRDCLTKQAAFNKDNEEVTCFVANVSDHTVILANKNLLLTQIDRSKPDRIMKQWPSGHTAPILTMSLNESSTRLCTGGADRKLKIWHIGSGSNKVFECFSHISRINIVKHQPGANVVVSVALMEHDIIAWDTETGKQLGKFTGHQATVTAIDFYTPSNQMITSSRDETVFVWDCKLFSKLVSISVQEEILSCAVITGGFQNQPESDPYLVMIGGESGIIRTLSVSKKKIIQEFKKSSIFHSNHIDESDGKDQSRTIRSIIVNNESIIVCRQNDSVEFYSREMRSQFELLGGLGDVRQMALVGTKRDRLLAVDTGSGRSCMRLFSCQSFFGQSNIDIDEDTSEEEKRLWPCQSIGGGHHKDISSLFVFNNGTGVVSGGKDGLVCVWRLENDCGCDRLSLVSTLAVPGAENGSQVSAIAAHEAGKYFFVTYSIAGDAVQLENSRGEEWIAVLIYTGTELKVASRCRSMHQKTVYCMDVNLTGTVVATGSRDRTVRIWKLKQDTNELVCEGKMAGHKGHVQSVQFSTKEQMLLTASRDKTVKLWSVKDFSCVSTYKSEHENLRAIFYNDESLIMSCNDKGFVSVWNRETCLLIDNFVKYDDPIYCLVEMIDYDNDEPKSRGFVVGGALSLICIYEDTTEKILAQQKIDKNLEIQQTQDLDNLLQAKEYSQAVKLSIKMNRPKLTYRLFKKIFYELSEQNMGVDSNILTIDNILKDLSIDDVKQVCQLALKWYMRYESLVLAQRIVFWVTSRLTEEQIRECIEFEESNAMVNKYDKYFATGELLNEKEQLVKFLNEKVDPFVAGDQNITQNVDQHMIDLTSDSESEMEM